MNYDKIIIDIANLSHNKFLEIYRTLNNGTRIKTTTDQDWIKRHDTDQADLAKMDYYELPKDWQKERWSGTKIAFDTLIQWTRFGKIIDDKFIEHASNIIHDEWLERNSHRAKDEHKLSYEQLSEEAKEKDRIFAKSAIEIYKKRKNN